MAERSREARELDRTLTHLIGKAWLDDHPLGNLSLLARLVRESCQGLALSDVLPRQDAYSVKDGDSLNPEMWQYLVYRSLRAVLFFDFARLAQSQLEPERLAGTVVLAFRWQVTAEPETGAVVPIEECTRRLTDNARSTAEFIQRLWAVFETEFNTKLPAGKKLPTPKSLPDASIFRGQSPTTFTNSYQDTELLSIFKRLLQIEPGFRLPPLKPAKNRARMDSGDEPQPSRSETLTAPMPQEPTANCATSLKDDGLFVTLREQLVKATDTLPALFHPQALDAVAIPRLCRSTFNNLRLLGQTALDLRPPGELFVEPALRRVALPLGGLTFLDDHEYLLTNLVTPRQTILLGQPGAGRTTVLARLAHQINQRPLTDGPTLLMMLPINADAFVTQATTLKLAAFAAQTLHEYGLVRDTPAEHLACRLEEWSQQGYVCWGIDNIDERLGDELDTLLVELRRVKSCLLALGVGTVNRPFIRKVQAALNNLDTVYALQPWGADYVRHFCERYLAIAAQNTGKETAALDDDPGCGLSVERMLWAANANPELAQTPLGLACLCASVENPGKFLNMTSLYISEHLYRAGFKPDAWLNTSAPALPITRALYRLVRAYWDTHKTLQSVIPMSASQVGNWLAPTDEPETRHDFVRAIRATRLLFPAYDNGALLFSHRAVYHHLLALAYLDDYERYWGEALLPSKVQPAFQDDLPGEIVGLIKDLAYARQAV